jgi:DNA polymerase III subunit chi
MQRVDFYVLEGSDARERWRFACRIIDKAFEAERRVLVCLDNATDLAAFDELLWTFAQDSFVPHEPLNGESDWEETPVLLSCALAPKTPADVVVNLGTGVPAAVAHSASVIEIIDADATRRQAGRVRYKQYKEMGVEPTTHKIGAAGTS